MSNLRKTGMLLASIVAFFAFFVQTTACFAERAGIIPCHEHQTHDETSSGSHEKEATDCCHVESSCVLLQSTTPAPLALSEATYHPRSEGAGDGPVEEIDYPPQILS